MSATVCLMCGGPLPPQRSSGRRRKWCSDRCRKRKYDLVCVECGGRVDGTTPSRNVREPVCAACTGAHYSAWPREAIILAIQEWADDHGGIPPSVNQWESARLHGAEFPSRTYISYRFGKWTTAVRAAGFEPHPFGPVGGYTPLTEAQRAECVRRYRNGESGPAIAADLGCAPAVVLKWARRAGVPARPPAFFKATA